MMMFLAVQSPFISYTTGHTYVHYQSMTSAIPMCDHSDDLLRGFLGGLWDGIRATSYCSKNTDSVFVVLF